MRNDDTSVGDAEQAMQKEDDASIRAIGMTRHFRMRDSITCDGSRGSTRVDPDASTPSFAGDALQQINKLTRHDARQQDACRLVPPDVFERVGLSSMSLARVT